MSPGKMAAQVAHATFLALEKQRKSWRGRKLIEKWAKSGMAVIILESDNLLGWQEYFKGDISLYVDEGMNEVAPGSITAAATGVMHTDDAWMFSKLILYGSKR